MASHTISQLNQFPCKTLFRGAPSKSQFHPCSSSFLPARPVVYPIKSRPFFVIRAVEEDSELPETSSSVAVVEEEKPKELKEVDSLKKQLVDSFYGSDRGLSASSETRAEVVELITQLEAKNPTPAPTEALTLLNGKWILAAYQCGLSSEAAEKSKRKL